MSFTLTRLRRRVSRYLAEGEGGLLDPLVRAASRRQPPPSSALGPPRVAEGAQ